MSNKKKVTVKKEQAAPVLKTVKKTHVVFRSRGIEGVEFVISGIRACQARTPGHIEWHVPMEKVAQFSKTYHVMRHRVVRVDD